MLSLLQLPLEQDGVLKVYVEVPLVEVVVWEDGFSDTASRGRICFGVEGSYIASRASHHTCITLKNMGLGFRCQGLSTTSHVLDGVQLNLDLLRQFVDGGEGARAGTASPSFSSSSAAAGGVRSGAAGRSRLEITDSIGISQVNLEIGYQDMKSAVSIVTKWMAAARARGVLERHGLHELMRAAQRAARAAAYSSVNSVLSTPSACASPSIPPNTPASAASASKVGAEREAGAGAEGLSLGMVRKFVMTSEQLRLCVMNDCVGFNVPLAQFVVSPFMVSSAPSARGLLARGVVKVEASFYSMLNQCFEPLLEPLKIEVSSEIDADASGAYNLVLTTKQRAEFNVAESHVCSALATIEAWTSDLSAHVKLQDAADLLRAHQTKVWPYTLKNDSGRPLRFWAGRSHVPAEQTSVHQVASGGTQVFAFASLPAQQAAGMGKNKSGGGDAIELHCITLEWLALDASETDELVTNVPVDGEGLHMFALPSGQVIVVELSLGVGGTRMVCVQSVVKVCNFCDHVLEVGVFTRQGEQLWSNDMAPEQHLCLPINLRNCYAIKVRPAGEQGQGLDAMSYEWSERILLPLRSQPSSLDWGLVTCLPAGAEYDADELDLAVSSEAGLRRYRTRVDAKRPATNALDDDPHAQVSASGPAAGSPDEGSVRAVISIHPILKILNALPERVSMSLLAANVEDRNETPLATRYMAPADTVFLYNADRKTALGLVILTPALQSVRHPALIFHPAGEKLCQKIQLVDTALNTELELHIDYDVSAWGDTTVVVYPPYIIHNYSGLHLVYGQVCADGTGLVGSAGSTVPAAGQDVRISTEPSMLAALLGLAFGQSQGHEQDSDRSVDCVCVCARGHAYVAPTNNWHCCMYVACVTLMPMPVLPRMWLGMSAVFCFQCLGFASNVAWHIAVMIMF